MSDLAQALMLAIRVHAGQVDKQGHPYLLHVIRVVDGVSDEAKVVAALHDTLEDCPNLTPDGVAEECSLNDDEFGALLAISRTCGNCRPLEPYAAYIEHVAAGGPIAREVKLADLRDNLGRIPTAAAELGRDEPQQWVSLRSRYEKAIAVLVSADP